MRVNTQYPVTDLSSNSPSRRFSDQILDWDIPPDLTKNREINPILRMLTREPFLRITSFQVVTQSEINEYFDYPKDQEKVLDGIDLIWRKEYLFSESLQDYLLEKLRSTANANKEFFSEINNPRNQKKWLSFYSEYMQLLENTKLTKTQKLLVATQSLELALCGSNTTETLRNINTGGTGSKGFRNELLAGWYLVKFIIGAVPKKHIDVLHSPMMPTYHSVVRENNKKERIKLKEPFVREIDIATPDSLSSVKSSGNHFANQVLDMFFVVMDSYVINQSTKDDLANKIRKLLLFRSSHDMNEMMPCYRKNGDYLKLKKEVVRLCEVEIEKLYPSDVQSIRLKSLVTNLISTSAIDIHFIPYIGCSDSKYEEDWVNNFHLWLQENFKTYDSKRMAC